MDIILYKCTDETNAFPKTLTEGVTISGTLRGECDMLAPVLTFSGDKGLWWFKEYNYIHIPDFNRYYFVSEMNVTSNASIEVACTIDVLQSWKDGILSLSSVVARNEFESDPYIIDDLVIMTPTNKDSIIQGSNINDFSPIRNSNDVLFVMHTASSDNILYGNSTNKMPFTGTGGIFYILTYKQLCEVFDEFWNTNFLDNLFVNYTEKANMVASLRAYPIDLLNFGSGSNLISEVKPILFGENESINITGFAYAVSGAFSTTTTLSRDLLQSCLTKGYMDYSTISEYKLYVPYIGYIDLDYHYINESDEIKLNYYLDVITGILYCEIISVINDVDIIISVEKNKIGIDCSISGGDTGVIRDKIISTALTAVGIAGAFVNPAITVGTHTVQNVTTTTTRNPATGRQIIAGRTTETQTRNSEYKTRPSVVSSGVDMISGLSSLSNARIPFSVKSDYGDVASFLNFWNRATIFYRRPERRYYENYGHYVGYPLYKTRMLNSVKGYTKVQDVHIEIPCTDTERELIDGLLKSGVIIKESV